MKLSFCELKKRDVINITDGKCLGRIINLELKFPEGLLTGIFVTGRKENFLFRLFNRSKVYIAESNIIKIGGDVILVNFNCGDGCAENSTTNSAKIVKPQKDGGCSPCFPLCSKGSPNTDNDGDFNDY